MSFLKDLLGIKPKPDTTFQIGHVMPVQRERVHRVEAELVEEKYKDFHVAYFPYSGKYKAAYKGKYLWRWFTTGLIDVDYHGSGSTVLDSERAAWRLIDTFIEQQEFPGSGVVIIRR